MSSVQSDSSFANAIEALKASQQDLLRTSSTYEKHLSELQGKLETCRQVSQGMNAQSLERGQESSDLCSDDKLGFGPADTLTRVMKSVRNVCDGTAKISELCPQLCSQLETTHKTRSTGHVAQSTYQAVLETLFAIIDAAHKARYHAVDVYTYAVYLANELCGASCVHNQSKGLAQDGIDWEEFGTEFESLDARLDAVIEKARSGAQDAIAWCAPHVGTPETDPLIHRLVSRYTELPKDKSMNRLLRVGCIYPPHTRYNDNEVERAYGYQTVVQNTLVDLESYPDWSLGLVKGGGENWEPSLSLALRSATKVTELLGHIEQRKSALRHLIEQDQSLTVTLAPEQQRECRPHERGDENEWARSMEAARSLLSDDNGILGELEQVFRTLHSTLSDQETTHDAE